MSKKHVSTVICVLAGLVLALGSIGSKAETPKVTGTHGSASAQSKRLEVPRFKDSAAPITVSEYSSGSTSHNVEDSPASARVVHDSQDGLSYETVIPRPTKKGYYEPKIVPYPVGKPVSVKGYYRKDGTYVRPHFRSLPRR